MSLHLYVLLLEGDRMDQLKAIFESFGYGDTGRDRTLLPPDEQALEEAFSDPRKTPNVVTKVAWVTHGWTAIWDPEMTMALDEKACCALSERFQGRILGVVWEGTLDSFSFALYDRGRLLRTVSGSLGEADGKGEPLDFEPEDPGEFDELEVVGVMRKIAGIDLASLHDTNRYVVKELIEKAACPPNGTEFTPQGGQTELQREIADLERIARGTMYSEEIPRRAREKLLSIASATHRPEWFRALAREALARLGQTESVPRKAGWWSRIRGKGGN